MACAAPYYSLDGGNNGGFWQTVLALSRHVMANRQSPRPEQPDRRPGSPESLMSAFLSWIWRSRLRYVYLAVALSAVALFSFWATLPDSSKEAILFGRPETRPEAEKDESVTLKPEDSGISQLAEKLPIDPRFLRMLKEHEKWGKIHFVPLAQVNLINEKIVLVWPAFTPEGFIIDNNVWGVNFRVLRGGVELGDADKIYGELRKYVDEKVDNNRYSILDREAGVPLEQLGRTFEGESKAFVESFRAGRYEEAVTAATKLSRLFNFDIINNPMTNLLVEMVEYGPLEHLKTTRYGDRARVAFGLKTEESVKSFVFEAREISGEGLRWTIVSMSFFEF